MKKLIASSLIVFSLFAMSCQNNSENSTDPKPNDQNISVQGGSETLGEQRVAVILADLIEDGKAQSVSEIKESIFTSQYSVNSFIKEASYGRTWLTGDVFGWIPAKHIDKCNLTKEQVFDLANNLLKYKNYDRYFIFLNQPDDCKNLGLGESSFGKLTFKTPQGVVTASVSYVLAQDRFGKPVLPKSRLAYLTSTVMAHELGHAFGIYGHANIFECGAETLTLGSVGCKQEAISDMGSIMSGESFFRTGLHYNACHKEELKWFKSEEVKVIKPSAIPVAGLDIDLLPFEKSGKGFLTARFDLDTPIKVTDKVFISKLYLEYRTPTGFDIGIQDLADAPEAVFKHFFKNPKAYPNNEPINVKGLQIRGGFFNEGRCTTTYLLDTKPESLQYDDQEYSLYDHLDAYLNPGEVFKEPNNQFSVKVMQINADGTLKVHIEKTAKPLSDIK